ncbi:AMIN domain-containing protein [bacterium]|nr:AMIN domain-containing protein [bacterium]MBU1989840.1 AMIN domain-containing protein [bacterium]
MFKIIFLLFFLLTISNARENPFFPSDGERDIPYTSNADKNLPPLKRATISLPNEARIIQKVTIEYKSLDGSVDTKSIELDNSIDWHLPVFISQSYSNLDEPKKKPKKRNYKQIASTQYIDFYSSDRSLKIITKDVIIRNFLLAKPHRIVLDLKRDASMKTFVKKNINGIFKTIRIGNHSGYYRVVIELDGHYRYKTSKTDEGYIFELE